MNEPQRALFDSADEAIARKYVNARYGAKAFDAATRQPAPDEIMSASIASTRDYFLQSAGCRNPAGEPFRIFPALIRTKETNALATRQDGLHICGVFYGLELISLELCLFAMAHPKVFPEIGDPGDLPLASEIRVSAGFLMLDHMLEHGKLIKAEIAEHIKPVGQERYNFAIYLTIMMLRFFWFHEMYHCLNGHAGSLVAVDPALALNEVQSDDDVLNAVRRLGNPFPLEAARYLQLLEMDADRSSLFGMIRTAAEDKENIIGIQAMPRDTRVRMAIFVSYLATYLFDQINARRVGQELATHPDAYARLHNLVRTVASNVVPAVPNAPQLFGRVLDELTALREIVPQLADPEMVIAHCIDPAFQGKLDKMEVDLDAVRPHFHRWAYTGHIAKSL